MKRLTQGLVALLLTAFVSTSAADPLLTGHDPLLQSKDPLLSKPKSSPQTSEGEEEKREEEPKRVVNRLGVALLMKGSGGGAFILMGESDGFYQNVTPFQWIVEGEKKGFTGVLPMLGLPMEYSGSSAKANLFAFASEVVRRKTGDGVRIKPEEFAGKPIVYSKSQQALFYLLRDDSLNTNSIDKAVYNARKNKSRSKADREFFKFHNVNVTQILNAARCARNENYPSMNSSACYRIKLDKRYILLDKYYIDAIGRDYTNAKASFEEIFGRKF